MYITHLMINMINLNTKYIEQVLIFKKNILKFVFYLTKLSPNKPNLISQEVAG